MEWVRCGVVWRGARLSYRITEGKTAGVLHELYRVGKGRGDRGLGTAADFRCPFGPISDCSTRLGGF